MQKSANMTSSIFSELTFPVMKPISRSDFRKWWAQMTWSNPFDSSSRYCSRQFTALDKCVRCLARVNPGHSPMLDVSQSWPTRSRNLSKNESIPRPVFPDKRIALSLPVVGLSLTRSDLFKITIFSWPLSSRPKSLSLASLNSIVSSTLDASSTRTRMSALLAAVIALWTPSFSTMSLVFSLIPAVSDRITGYPPRSIWNKT